ncbi:MaoC family dehydratase [Mesorhizobium australicum]|uniref:Acyl dehydratase n=1 Tax=Mesorhizobium australicum TaxID=536018 RepID=A0A1X7PPW6_9HYPH|nr:MaoC family dehydratase [Mesorhizobium australicum]SMH54048.1 Acyl dehydratase [Mesorhizobium australicum]
MSDIDSTSQIWLEDFVPGTVLTSPSRLVTIEDIDTWAALTGERHPVHMDDAFAQAAGFRGRVAHGLFSLALVEGLKAEIGVFERSVIASLGWNNVKFSAPLYPGDNVHLRLTLVSKRSSSKPGKGIAEERGVLVKEDGTEVVSGDHIVILLSRPE